MKNMILSKPKECSISIPTSQFSSTEISWWSSINRSE